MNAYKITLLGKLLGVDSRQFIIPIYQRKYKWDKEQCDRLIDDIIKAGNTNKEHFTGTVVYNTLPSGSFTQVHLVDGQQRVTTIMLMIKALQILSAPKKDEQDYLYVFNKTLNYIYADKDDPTQGLKLVPSKNDEKTFNIIIKANSFEDIETNDQIIKNEDNHLYNNFKSIYLKFQSLDKDGKGVLRNTILNGMQLLTIVEMSLEKDDDPQAIFESINSLGLKLSNADLIRNYLLMSNVKQKELYEKYWEVIQDTFIQENNMEFFVFNYLLTRKNYTINNDDIYKEYVKYANDTFGTNEIDKEQLLIDLYNVAKVYQPFIRNTKSYSANTNMLMQELRDMDQTTAYPFLIQVFLDKENRLIDEEVLDRVINLIIVYLVRRTICGVPTRSLRGFMLNLYNRVFKVTENKNRYFESIYAFLAQLETNDRLRRIDEVFEALKTAEIYKNVKFTTYLLYRIENGRYPKAYSEFTLANSISVEHIMPQTLTDEWIIMLGDDAENIHRQYLNTLGNLSLSSRSKNSIMSNESFIIKRDILNTVGSKFIELNKDIKVDQEVFGKKEIEDREERLSDIVCSKYDLGEINIEGIKFEDSVEVIGSIDHEDIYSCSEPIAYKLFGVEHPIDSFPKIIVAVAKSLFDIKPELMRELAETKYSPWGGENGYIHYKIDDNDKDSEVGENIRVHTAYKAGYCVQFTTLLLQRFGYDASSLIVYLKKDSVKTRDILTKQNRISMVRDALALLAQEGKVIYNKETMPKSDNWIKFQTEELNNAFEFNGMTKWDGEQFPYISYLEYQLASNTIMLTYKLTKDKVSITEKLRNNIEELSLTNEDSGNYWHLKQYKVDYKSVVESSDKIITMKKQIELLLDIIQKDLVTINNVLK